MEKIKFKLENLFIGKMTPHLLKLLLYLRRPSFQGNNWAKKDSYEDGREDKLCQSGGTHVKTMMCEVK